MKRTLGTCYYPEHWPRVIWEEDARRMVETGLTWVRIGEFAWSKLEPVPDQYQWDWLDQAIEVLGRAGLKVVLGTPTATPPRWMLDRHPDMLAVDVQGRRQVRLAPALLFQPRGVQTGMCPDRHGAGNALRSKPFCRSMADRQ